MDCYYHPSRKDYISIPSDIQFDPDTIAENFSDELKKIKKAKKEYLKIPVITGSESFKIMEHFADQVRSTALKVDLEEVLSNKRPFQNFNHLINQSDYRQEWFDFKTKAYEGYVMKTLKAKMKF